MDCMPNQLPGRLMGLVELCASFVSLPFLTALELAPSVWGKLQPRWLLWQPQPASL